MVRRKPLKAGTPTITRWNARPFDRWNDEQRCMILRAKVPLSSTSASRGGGTH